jgi:hypothetical protein
MMHQSGSLRVFSIGGVKGEGCTKHGSVVSKCIEPVYIRKTVLQATSKIHYVYFLSSLHINTSPFPIPQIGQAKYESPRLPRWRSLLLAKRVFYAVRRFVINFVRSLTLAMNVPSKSLHTFFFRWRYRPLWALACRTIPLHLSLSITNSLHLLTPQHLKISFYFFFPTFPGSSSSSRPFQFLSEDLFGHPILLHSLQVTQPTYPLPLYPFYSLLRNPYIPFITKCSHHWLLTLREKRQYFYIHCFLIYEKAYFSKVPRHCPFALLVIASRGWQTTMNHWWNDTDRGIPAS